MKKRIKKQWKLSHKDNGKWAKTVNADSEKEALRIGREKWPMENFDKAEFLK